MINLQSLSLLLLLFGEPLVQCVSVLPYDLTRLDPIEVSAVGRVAKLGEFYDVRTERFLHLPIFKSSLDNSSYERTQNQATLLKYTLVNTFDAKFRLMDISAELKISILGGLIPLKASGSFFKDTKTSAKTAQASLIQSVSNVYEQISLLDSSLQSKINFDIVSKLDATHVVVGIQWGGSVFISVEDSNEENEDVQKVQGELGATMRLAQAALSSVSIGGKLNFSEKEIKQLNRYSVTLDGDLVPTSVPQTLIEALRFMKQSPELLLRANDGKGKPIKYTMLPLAGLRKFWDIEEKVTQLINRIDQVTIQNCVRLFDEMSLISQRINDVYDQVTKYEKYLLLEKINQVTDLRNQFEGFNTALTADLSDQLVLVRSGNESGSTLQRILNEATTHRKLWHSSNDPILTSTVREISFIEALQKQNILVFDREVVLNRFLWENSNKDIYILFFNYSNNIMSDQALGMLKILADKRNASSADLLVATNYDFVSDDKQVSRWNKTNKICVYRNGEIVFDNYPDGQKNNQTVDPGTWSLKQVQKHVEDVEKRLNEHSAIPEGFIYVQLPHQPQPATIWDGTKWEDISLDYAGLFFRTVGGNAASFQQTQEDFAPSNRIVKSANTYKKYYHGGYWDSIEEYFPRDGWTGDIRVGLVPEGVASDWEMLRFYSESTTGEVRPRNTAVKIWKRV